MSSELIAVFGLGFSAGAITLGVIWLLILRAMEGSE